MKPYFLSTPGTAQGWLKPSLVDCEYTHLMYVAALIRAHHPLYYGTPTRNETDTGVSFFAQVGHRGYELSITADETLWRVDDCLARQFAYGVVPEMTDEAITSALDRCLATLQHKIEKASGSKALPE